jgi:response regulator RpfG family c-di-GMP phosphodiesterase
MTMPASPGEGQVITILFVDDEPQILRLIARMLRGSPFTVLSAGSGADALTLMRQRNVDVLVSDIDMPQMSGLDLVKIVRREFPATLRMLLTGAASMARTIEAINEGEVHRFFTKPFDHALFHETITALAERIEKLRRSGELDARSAHEREFFRWIEHVYPGTLDVSRNERGEILIGDALEDLALLDSGRRSRS